jgi:carbonic anhydrase/acetyltransferase-like protein (isoleucine patch superfamily)
VIRADEVNEFGEMEPIIIGANSNIQDGVVIHSRRQFWFLLFATAL